jgi:hypothetical protein
MSFWDVLLVLFLYVPLLVLLGVAVIDIFRRRDIGGLKKTLWLIVMVFLPIVGPLVYLVIRPPGTTEREREMDLARQADEAGGAGSTQDLVALSDMHDRGKLTDAEYEHLKNRQMASWGMPGSVREQRGSQLL